MWLLGGLSHRDPWNRLIWILSARRTPDVAKSRLTPRGSTEKPRISPGARVGSLITSLTQAILAYPLGAPCSAVDGLRKGRESLGRPLSGAAADPWVMCEISDNVSWSASASYACMDVTI